MDPMCVQNTLALHGVDQAPGLCFKKKKNYDKICKQKCQSLELKAAFTQISVLENSNVGH